VQQPCDDRRGEHRSGERRSSNSSCVSGSAGAAGIRPLPCALAKPTCDIESAADSNLDTKKRSASFAHTFCQCAKTNRPAPARERYTCAIDAAARTAAQGDLGHQGASAADMASQAPADAHHPRAADTGEKTESAASNCHTAATSAGSNTQG
jgi:hypothetical protein